jgi:hypothetical protein
MKSRTDIEIKNSTISWGGVWAGFFVALGFQAVLASIGMGAGFHAMSRSGADHFPMSVTVWTGISWMLSAFLGAYVAVWMSGLYSYWEGMFHGLVTWGVLMSALAYLPTYGDLAVLTQSTKKMGSMETTQWWVLISGILSSGFAVLGGVIGSRAAERTQLREQYRTAS